MWFHDHTLGMTRANVYAGPAGFYLLRGGPSDAFDGHAARDRRRRSAIRRDGRITRSRSRSRTARSTRTVRCSTPPAARSSRGSSRRSCRSRSCPTRRAAVRATSRRSGIPSSSATRSSSTARTWPFARGRAAALSLPLPQRLQRALPDPADVERTAVLADRQRGWLPAGAGRARPSCCWRRRSAPTSSSTSRTSRSGPRSSCRTSARTSRSVAERPGVDFEPADPETTGQVMRFRVVPRGAPTRARPPSRLVLPRDRALGPRRHARASPSTSRSPRPCGSSTTRRQHRPGLPRRRAFGPARPTWAPSNRTAQAARSAGTSRSPRTLRSAPSRCGNPQLHRRRAPDPHPRGHVRGRRRRRIEGGADGRRRRGRRAQGHGDRLPERGHAREGALRPRRACSCGTATSSSTRTTR